MTERRKRRRRQRRGIEMAPVDGFRDSIEYYGGRMFVVGYTGGGAPYGVVEWPAGSLIDRDGAPDEWAEDAEPF